jgi:hypothetical protein
MSGPEDGITRLSRPLESTDREPSRRAMEIALACLPAALLGPSVDWRARSSWQRRALRSSRGVEGELKPEGLSWSEPTRQRRGARRGGPEGDQVKDPMRVDGGPTW